MTVDDAVTCAAHMLHTSRWQLREHMREVDFDPRRPIKYEVTKEAVEHLMQQPCCGKIGATFMEARLRTVFGCSVNGFSHCFMDSFRCWCAERF